MLTPKEMINRIRHARRLLHKIQIGTDIPQIQSILRHADQNLHWALWNLGQVDALRPDLPGSVATPGKPMTTANAAQRRKARRRGPRR